MVRICCGAVALVVASAPVCSGQSAGRQRTRPIEFSAPRSDEVITNLHQLTSRKDSLKQLEEDLYAPLQSFSPRSSLEGVVAPPPRPVRPSTIQSKRVKELLDRRKNWMFMTPEDLLSAPTVEKILNQPEYTTDGQEKKDLGPLEGYYERLASKRPTKPTPGLDNDEDIFSTAKKLNAPGVDPTREEPELPGGLKESAEKLRSFLGDSGSPFSESETPSSYNDPFRVGHKPPTPEQTQAHKKLMDQYRALLQPSAPSPLVVNAEKSLPGVGDSSLSAPKPAAEPSAPSPPPRRGLVSQLDIVNPLLGPAPLPDVNARAVGQSRPLPTPQARRTLPELPDFAAPRRPF